MPSREVRDYGCVRRWALTSAHHKPQPPGWALWVLADASPWRAAQVVVGAGAVEHSQLVDLAGNAFGGLPAGGPSTEELVQKARRRAGLTNGF